jgi:ribosomal-protein-alanine N-acetyltransferase
MVFGKTFRNHQVRLAKPEDGEAARELIARAWHSYVRFPPDKTPYHFQSEVGWVADGGNGIGGLMLAEIHPLSIALITAAAVSDDWPVFSYLDTFLPVVEETLRSQALTAVVQVGYAPWLTDVLFQRGFVNRDWVVTYEWRNQPVSVQGNPSVTIRSAHPDDLPTLLSLDRRIFGPIWHKPAIHFEQALAGAFLFTVAQKDNEILGYQWCELNDWHGHITRLAVRPDYEGQGVGTRLLTEAMVAMVKAGIGWITLNTQQSNLRSQMLYERYGFRLAYDRVAVLCKDL